MTMQWSGQWVADRLDLRLITDARSSLTGLELADLAGLALRRNPKRAHLLVSTVLGKHVPTDPRIVYGAGRLLGALVLEHLGGSPGQSAVEGGARLRSALNADAGAAGDLLVWCDAQGPVGEYPAVVLGYAETATGLGHSVADSLGARYLHSTRRAVPGIESLAGFEEEHSHATSHLLLPEDRRLLVNDDPVVLVDDELSTGQTVLNTIAALHARWPRERYVIAALIDVRSDVDRRRLDSAAIDLGVQIEVVALASGHI
jgi:adenine/guanine phosphoribosyltransferase-like PRPP-binding protein